MRLITILAALMALSTMVLAGQESRGSKQSFGNESAHGRKGGTDIGGARSAASFGAEGVHSSKVSFDGGSSVGNG